MAAQKITTGIAKVEIDGDQLGYVEEDSFLINVEDNTTTTEFRVEEEEDPIYVTRSGSKIASFEFKIADPDATTIEKLWGGTSSGGDVTIAGFSKVLDDVSFLVESKLGWDISIESASVSAAPSGEMGRNSIFGIVVTVTPQGPIKFLDGDNEGGGG